MPRARPAPASPHPLGSARWHGQKVGILGGSFNPPHAGHAHIAKQAMIRFGLDAVWWLVSPGNPLKTPDPEADFDARVALTRAFVTHPRMLTCTLEGQINTRFTYDTIKTLKRLYPRTDFIWIAGMDNARIFSKWERWQDLPKMVPFVFFNRPPGGMKLCGNVLRQHKGWQASHSPVKGKMPAQGPRLYWMERGRAVPLSSTLIRAQIRAARAAHAQSLKITKNKSKQKLKGA